jgi:hypothetical protein
MESAMRKLVVLLLLLLAGCESDFYHQDTRTWFSNPPTLSAEKSDQGSPVVKSDKPQQ